MSEVDHMDEVNNTGDATIGGNSNSDLLVQIGSMMSSVQVFFNTVQEQIQQNDLKTNQHLNQQFVALERRVRSLSPIPVPESTKVPSEKYKYYPRIRISLVLDADKAKMKNAHPTDLWKSVRKEGTEWERVQAVEYNRERLVLWLDTAADVEAIRTQNLDIPEELGLSQGCRVLFAHYCVQAKGRNISDDMKPLIDRFVSGLSQKYEVTIVRGQFDYGKLILSCPNLADALRLCSKPQCFSAGFVCEFV